MHNATKTRRQFVKNIAGSASLLSIPFLLQAKTGKPGEKKKIVVVGGHPDDPECGCGGSIPLFVKAGHDVTIMYFTNGDEGIEDKTPEQAKAIRQQEAMAACKVLGTKPLFVGQVDGESVLGNPEMAQFEKLLYAEQPDVVFAHWPIDAHKDHQLSSVLTIQAWLETPKPFTLYFYEVCTGMQSFLFHPTDYIDITSTHTIKMQALACHTSQDIIVGGKYTKNMLDCGHPAMQEFRGREFGVPLAEAFIRMPAKGLGQLML